MPNQTTGGTNWHFRGKFDARIPDLHTIVWSAVEGLDVPPSINGPMSPGSRWMVIYYDTPARMAFGHTRRQWQDIPANTAIMITPATPYSIDTRVHPGPSHHLWIMLDGVHELPLFALTEGGHRYVRFDDPDRTLLHEFKRYIDLVEAHLDAPFWTMQTGSRSLLARLSQVTAVAPGRYRVNPSPDIRPVDPIVGRVLAFLEKHLAERVRLEDIAHHLHASPSTVSHRYREFAGEAPMQTLRRLRLLRAKLLLLRGELTADIAERVGFYDERHLWSAFKQSEGMSPREFVKVNREALCKI